MSFICYKVNEFDSKFIMDQKRLAIQKGATEFISILIKNFLLFHMNGIHHLCIFWQSNCFLRNGTNSNNCWHHDLRESIYFFWLITFLYRPYDVANGKPLLDSFGIFILKRLRQSIVNIIFNVPKIKRHVRPKP